MYTKFFRKLSGSITKSNYITNFRRPCQPMIRNVHDWKRQMSLNQEKRKVIPKLVYLHNPWKYMIAKLNLLKLKIFWDPHFAESEFIRGAKQAAAVITDTIRNQNGSKIKEFTTPFGYKQITRDMMLSRDDTRLKLVRFEAEHLRRALPMNVITKQNYDTGHRFCFIDMLFVGLRNSKDFDTAEEAVEIKDILQKLDTDFESAHELSSASHRILFAEIFIRFRRDYTEYAEDQHHLQRSDNDNREWSVSFYKILTFDVLNYDTRQS